MISVKVICYVRDIVCSFFTFKELKIVIYPRLFLTYEQDSKYMEIWMDGWMDRWMIILIR